MSFRNSFIRPRLLMAPAIVATLVAVGDCRGGPGDLDASFGVAGKVVTAIGTTQDTGSSVAVLSDGKLLVAGTSSAGSANAFALIRYHADGSLDASFNQTGMVTTTFPEGSSSATSLVLLEDGKILVAGYARSRDLSALPLTRYTNDFAVARYHANGTLDTSFNGTGLLTVTVGQSDDIVRKLLVQPDGKILLAGYSQVGQDNVCALVRLEADGRLDATFNSTGRVLVSLGIDDSVIQDMVLQSDGKIIVGGYADGTQFDRDFVLMRFEVDGGLDTTFGVNGLVFTIAPGSEACFSLALQADGRLLAVGGRQVGNTVDLVLARYDSNGGLDSTFGSGGKVVSSLSASATAVVVQGDGRIVVAGTGRTGIAFDRSFILARYHANGSLDTSVKGTGSATTMFTSYVAHTAAGMALQSDGKVVVVGSLGQGTAKDVALVRFVGGSAPYVTTSSATGAQQMGVTLNGTVNPNGLVTTARFEWGTTPGYGNNTPITLSPTDGIGDQSVSSTLGALTPGTTYHWRLVASNADGTEATSSGTFTTRSPSSLDLTFGANGTVAADYLGRYSRATSVARQPDGKIVVAGIVKTPTASPFILNDDFLVARFLADGSLDSSFANSGMLVREIGTSTDTASAVAVLTNGKILVAGSSTGLGFAVIRCLPDGTLDSSFGSAGISTAFVGTSGGSLRGMALQSDGKILLVGSAARNSSFGYSVTDFATVRFLPDGALDTSFGSGGKVITAFSANNSEAAAVVVQGDGKIVVVGSNLATKTGYDFAAIRYLPNGKPDSSFGKAGKVLTALSPRDDRANDVVLQTDGRILVGGASALVRYLTNGSLDKAFQGTGYVLTTSSAGAYGCRSLVLQADGKIVVAGLPSFTLARYHHDGRLDLSFSDTGLKSGPSGELADMLIQPDGRILAVGGGPGSTAFNSDIVLARYEGISPDISITGNGQVITSGDTTPSLLDHTDFGSVAAGGGSLSRTFTLQNTDLLALHLTGTSPDYVASEFFSAFRITRQPATHIIAPGATETFTVDFVPAYSLHQGPQTATITVKSNDKDEGVFSFKVSGTGVNDTIRPTLLVASPRTAVVRSALPFTFSGSAADRYGIRRVKLTLNGLSQDAQLGAPSASSVPWSWVGNPRAGLNTLIITAYDMRGNSTKVIRNFNFEPR